MSFRPFEFLSLVQLVELVLEWLLWHSLFFAALGLLVAYGAAKWLGFDHALVSWILAVSGFLYGLKFDWADLQSGPSRSTIAVIGYLGFAAFMMAAEVILVLHYFHLKPAGS